MKRKLKPPILNTEGIIATPVHKVNRTVLVINIPTGRFLSFGSRYQDCSWVAFLLGILPIKIRLNGLNLNIITEG
jgi:hypothetical protein